MTVAELQALRAAGEAVVPVDKAEPWKVVHVSRASFYRAVQRNEVPGVLRLGRRRLLRLDAFLGWIGADSSDCRCADPAKLADLSPGASSPGASAGGQVQ